MIEPLTEQVVACPYCGARFVALIDTSEGDSGYIQDCEICCQPIRFDVRLDGAGEATVDVAREDD